MSTLFLTLLIAFILVILAIASLSIGWLFSGKSKIKRGHHTMNEHQHKHKQTPQEEDSLKCDLCNEDVDQDKVNDAKNEDENKKVNQ